MLTLVLVNYFNILYKFLGNVAHGVLHGIQFFPGDGINPCSLIRNFVIYKAWDYGIYHQTSNSIVVKNTIIADSTVSFYVVHKARQYDYFSPLGFTRYSQNPREDLSKQGVEATP